MYAQSNTKSSHSKLGIGVMAMLLNSFSEVGLVAFRNGIMRGFLTCKASTLREETLVIEVSEESSSFENS